MLPLADAKQTNPRVYGLNSHARDALPPLKKAIKKEIEDPIDIVPLLEPSFLTKCGHILSLKNIYILISRDLKLICPSCKSEGSPHLKDFDAAAIVFPVLECVKEACKKLDDPKAVINLAPVLQFCEAQHEEDFITECGHYVSANTLRTTQKVVDLKQIVTDVKCPNCPRQKVSAYPYRPLRAIASKISEFVQLNNSKVTFIQKVINSDCVRDAQKAAECAVTLSAEELNQFHAFLLNALKIQLNKRTVNVDVIVSLLKILSPEKRITFLINKVFDDLELTWFSSTKAVKAEQAFCKVFDDTVQEREDLKRYEILFFTFWFRAAISCDIGCLSNDNYTKLCKFRSHIQARLQGHPVASANLDWSWANALISDNPKAEPRNRDTFFLSLEYISYQITARPISYEVRDLVELTAKLIITALHHPLSGSALDRVFEVYPQVLPNLVQSVQEYTSRKNNGKKHLNALTGFETFQFWLHRIRNNQFQHLGVLSPTVLAMIFNSIDATEIPVMYSEFLLLVNAILHIINTYTPDDQTLKLQFFEGCYDVLCGMRDTTSYAPLFDVLYKDLKNPTFFVELKRCEVLSRSSNPAHLQATWDHIITMMQKGPPENLKARFHAFIQVQLTENVRLNVKSFMDIFRYLYAQHELYLCVKCLKFMISYVFEPDMDDNFEFSVAAMEEMLTTLLARRLDLFGMYDEDYLSFVKASLDNFFYLLFMKKSHLPQKSFQDKIFDLIEFKGMNISNPEQLNNRASAMTEWIKQLLTFQTVEYFEIAKYFLQRALKENIFGANSVRGKQAVREIALSHLQFKSQCGRPAH